MAPHNREVSIIAADHKGLYGSLGPIVAQFNASVFKKSYKLLLLIQSVVNSFAQETFRQNGWAHLLEPFLESLCDGTAS